MLSDEQRIRIYGSAERVAEVDAQIKANIDRMPPLSQRQRDQLRILLRPNPANTLAESPSQRARRAALGESIASPSEAQAA